MGFDSVVKERLSLEIEEKKEEEEEEEDESVDGSKVFITTNV